MAFSTPFTAGIVVVNRGQTNSAISDLRARFLVHESGYLPSINALDDRYAPQAAYIGVMKSDGRCLALARIIHAGAQGFEVDSRLNPQDFVTISESSIEISEMIIDPSARATTVSLQLALGLAGYLKQHEPDTVFAISTKETAQHYTRLGMSVRWDVEVMSTWGVPMWLCYAHPGSIILEKIIENTPAVYRTTVDRYLSSIATPNQKFGN